MEKTRLFLFELVRDSHAVSFMEGGPGLYGNPPRREVGMKLKDGAEGEDGSHSRETDLAPSPSRDLPFIRDETAAISQTNNEPPERN